MPGLTPKQAAFVREYLVDLNGTQAAIRAGYSKKTASKMAYELLHDVPYVMEAIDKAKAERLERLKLKADDVLVELARIATLDVARACDEEGNLLPPHKMPEDVRRAVSGVEQSLVGMKYRFADKLRALELIGKHLTMFKDQVEHSGGVAINVVDPYAKAPRNG